MNTLKSVRSYTWILLVVLSFGSASVFAAAPKPGDIASIKDVSFLTRKKIDDYRKDLGDEDTGRSKYRIGLFQILYYTPGIHGNLETASALLMVPNVFKPVPLISVQHKVISLRSLAPSTNPYGSESLTALVFFASKGYAVVMPDGLGLGLSSAPFNPFLHAATEGTSGRDLIIAAQRFFKFFGVNLNGQLFLAGYSFGGHTTMAMHREIQKNPIPGLTIAASAAMAGPLDLSGTCFPLLLKQPGTTSSVYAAALLHSSQKIYGGIFSSWSEAFQSPYDKLVPTLFDGKTDLLDIYAQLAKTPQELLQPAYLAALTSKADHPFLKALEVNNVYQWTPAAPVLLIHSTADATIPYQNAVKAADYINANGGSATLRLLTSGLGHSATFFPASKIAADYFKPFRK